MLDLLEQTRFLALAYHNVRARELDDQVPGRVMESLRAANAQALARYHLLGGMVSPHLEALSREVDFLVLKGTAWAHTVYPQPHLRQSGDIDLLVQEKDQATAGRVLEGRGFGGGPDPMSADHGSTYALAHATGAVVYFELHPALGRAADHPHVRTADAWRCAQSLVVWGVTSRSPGNTVGIAHLAAQLATDIYMRPYIRYLVDLQFLAKGGDVSTDDLAAMLTDGGLRGLAHCAATLAGVAVPLPRPRPAARLATALVAAAGWEVRLGMPTGWWGLVSRLATLMLFDRYGDRLRRLRSHARHAQARRRHSRRDGRDSRHDM